MSCPGAFERAAGSFYRWKDLGGGNYVLKTGKTWRKRDPGEDPFRRQETL
jgi:hypothetical protein